MIEISRTLKDADRLAAWLERVVRPHLTADVSRYAPGRLRVWLGKEPTFGDPWRELPGLELDERVSRKLAEMIEWPFDYCLVTYSGDEAARGILPHRDAAYADFEAYGLHLTGECRFDYWCGKESFGRARDTVSLTPGRDAPTHSLRLQPGQVVRFNCKNVHAAAPGARRWNLNFWRRKPVLAGQQSLEF